VSDLAGALDVVGSRWALLIVERLLDGPQRYGDLHRDLGVPTNMLATRLRELEAAGVLSRLPLRQNTRAYALTNRGLALREAIIALGRWGAEETWFGPSPGDADRPEQAEASRDCSGEGHG
jgi:DNA-binding HxlR family transcriptional regulator